jgi:hypothetical protein
MRYFLTWTCFSSEQRRSDIKDCLKDETASAGPPRSVGEVNGYGL